jgi:ATP-dependent RNA helicase DDX21
MLKQGFQEDVEKILKFISQRSPIRTQKLLFSATVPKWVEELASKFMSKSKKLIDLIKKFEIKTSKTIEHLSLCLSKDKRTLSETIRNLIGIYAGTHGSVIIFCETKR